MMTTRIARAVEAPFRRLAAEFAERVRRRRDRRELLSMSVRDLKDIGLRPDDVWSLKREC